MGGGTGEGRVFSPQGQLAMSEDSYGCHAGAGGRVLLASSE